MIVFLSFSIHTCGLWTIWLIISVQKYQKRTIKTKTQLYDDQSFQNILKETNTYFINEYTVVLLIIILHHI